MGIVTQAHDIADIFDAYRLICIARNYPDVPTTIDDLTPGTRETIRHAAYLREQERREARHARLMEMGIDTRRGVA